MSHENGNGSQNGHGAGGTRFEKIGGGGGGRERARLLKLLAFHDHAAAAIRLTLDLLDQSLTVHKHATHETVLDAAIAIERARRAHRARPETPPKRGRPLVTGATRPAVKRRARRAETGAFLAAFPPSGSGSLSLAQLREIHGTEFQRRGLNALIRHGYLKRHKDGSYSRTAIVFTP